jgi:hypothetical protein
MNTHPLGLETRVRETRGGFRMEGTAPSPVKPPPMPSDAASSAKPPRKLLVLLPGCSP